MSGQVHVGIDGGGTHARAVVVDAFGRELARVTGGAGLVDPRDPAAAAAAVAALVRTAAREAGADLPVAALGCGLAGAGRAPEAEAVRAILSGGGVAERVVVMGDAAAAMQDAFGNGPGLLLVAGTGSIAFARNAAGEEIRVGGWGGLLGDEGSAYALGIAALRAVARATDGRREPTMLADALLAYTGVLEPGSLIAWSAAAGKAAIAALAPGVLACAAAADAAAVAIRDSAVAELAELAECAARRAVLSSPQLALTGGLLQPGGPLRSAVVAALRHSLPELTFIERQVDAALGAARRAMIVAATPAADTTRT